MLLAQQLLVLGFGVVVLGMRVADVRLLAVAVLAWATTLLCVGTALATVLRSQAEFSAVQDIGSFVATSLGGALVPLAALPGWARHLGHAQADHAAVRQVGGAGGMHANTIEAGLAARHLAPASPAYWAMSALHGAVVGASGQVWRAAGVLLAVALVAAAVAAWRIGRGWRRSTLL